MLAVSREALTRIYFLSYAWRMTGDDRYARRAEREMLNVCAFPDWNSSHFLDVSGDDDGPWPSVTTGCMTALRSRRGGRLPKRCSGWASPKGCLKPLRRPKIASG